MTATFPEYSDLFDCVQDFVGMTQFGEVTPAQLTEFEHLLRENKEARRLYTELIKMSVHLPRVLTGIGIGNDDGDEGVATGGDGNSVQHSSFNVQSTPSSPPFPSSLAPTFLSTTLPSTVGFFSSGWPVAYLVATVIFGLGLLIGSVVQVSSPVQVARQSASLPSPLSPLPKMVGRITGMVNCRWKDPGFRVQGSEPVVSGQWSAAGGQKQSELGSSSHQAPATSHLVSLGDKFALASGLMEITYDTGAKVILQGPVSYEAESNGGYLSVGKLTGKLETKAQDLRPKTADPSSFILHPSSFVIHTPTATVTDLGTEFGVEVTKAGDTVSHVFRGSVRLQAVSAAGKAEAVVLGKNESARVEAGSSARGGGNRAIVLVSSVKPADFVREIPKLTVKTLDLVDVVAGGNGFSGRRGCGINPATGRPADAQPVPRALNGDHQYHRAESLPFVDGVFIPEGSKGPVQIDSAGHTFDDFGKTTNECCGLVWAGGPIAFVDPHEVVPAKLGGVDYASPGHGVLALLNNMGVTFDLEAMRRANPGCKLLRFRAIGGNPETSSQQGRATFGDLRVFVDGQVRYQRREINAYNGIMPINIPLADRDRFLTLVSSDCGNGSGFDWIMFGDPRLEVTTNEDRAEETKREN